MHVVHVHVQRVSHRDGGMFVYVHTEVIIQNICLSERLRRCLHNIPDLEAVQLRYCQCMCRNMSPEHPYWKSLMVHSFTLHQNYEAIIYAPLKIIDSSSSFSGIQWNLLFLEINERTLTETSQICIFIDLQFYIVVLRLLVYIILVSTVSISSSN